MAAELIAAIAHTSAIDHGHPQHLILPSIKMFVHNTSWHYPRSSSLSLNLASQCHAEPKACARPSCVRSICDCGHVPCCTVCRGTCEVLALVQHVHAARNTVCCSELAQVHERERNHRGALHIQRAPCRASSDGSCNLMSCPAWLMHVHPLDSMLCTSSYE
jgi:hypothetical protein